MSSTRVSCHVNAPRASVYRALLDGNAIATWMVPSGMTSHVHAFDGREGGTFHISLTYDARTGVGKTTAHTDTFHGRFVKLVPNEQVVEVVEFETADPGLRTRAALQLEMLALRHQLTVYQRGHRRAPTQVADRLLWAWLSRTWARWRCFLCGSPFGRPDPRASLSAPPRFPPGRAARPRPRGRREARGLPPGPPPILHLPILLDAGADRRCSSSQATPQVTTTARPR